MFTTPSAAPNVGWAFMFGITSILGAWGAGTLGQSDWTRYAKTRHAPTPSQLIAAPLTVATTAIIGIVVTSAARDVLGGEIIWSPIALLAAIQDHYSSSSGVRAGVFFAALGLVASQLSVRAPSRPPVACRADEADFRGAQRRVVRHGHGWSVAQVHQH